MAALISYPVRSPQWLLNYKGVNITADISQMVLSVTYTDHLTGLAGEIEVELEDHEKRWQGSWYPQEGDLVNLMIGYQGEPLLPCGDFQVDDLELEFPPDTFHLRCLAAFVTPAMRTRNCAGYENQTLIQIATGVAAKYNLEMITAPGLTSLTFARVTQARETDLEFLHRLARAGNYDFTIRGGRMVFYARPGLEAQPATISVSRADLLRGAFRSKTHHIYRTAQVSYQDPASKQLLTQAVDMTPNPASGDNLKIVTRCENGQQALLRSQSALHAANMLQTTARLELPGNPSLSAGNTIALNDFGANDGVYLIESARHRVTRTAGYTTEIQGRRVR